MNIEASFIQWLGELGYEAYATVPKSRPDSFVTVERTGGDADNLLDSPYLAVQVWDTTRQAAADNAAAIRLSCLEASQAGNLPDGIYTVRGGSLYWFPDPDSRQARYQITFNVTSKL